MLTRAISLASLRQALKTAIAGVLALWITDLFHLPQGYWAAITALIVMQSNVGATVTASRTRLAGTAVGALVGGLFVALFGANMLGFALAVTIAYLTCDLLRLTDSQRLATVTVAIIMLISANAAAWVIALHRFSEVALGIVVALVVSLTVWPSHARRSVRQGLADTLGKLALLFRAILRGYRGWEDASVEALKLDVSAAIQKNANLLQNALEEAFGPMKEREMLAQLVRQVERIFHSVETLEFAVSDSASDTYVRTFESGLERLEIAIAAALEALAKTIASGKVCPEWPDLGAIMAALDAEAAGSRKTGAPIRHPLDEILRFYFVLFTCRNLIDELESIRGLTALRLPAV
ncbi:MAG TPA: FUSC family protein [Bryobacteraceae bacterium]|nr:FUSC family protein [Bryobacteraceae bacterium]